MSRIPRGSTAVSIHYDLYLQQTLRLVSSLVIKSEHTVAQMNLKVQLGGYQINPSVPNSWKYYMNLYGEHHEADVPMYITSQDTFEIIEFNKETLKDHLITRRSYRELGRFYKALVEAYPDQELLIRGILSPIGYDVSVDARDHKILGYDTSLIESQEQFLMPEIQDFIDGMYDRWYNQDYNRLEPLYRTFMDANLYASLPMQIILARKRRRYTDLAHSYHIRMYLLSFSKKIGDEFNYLSKNQRLWLYRNIKYLNLNIGTNETLEEVIHHIMNERGFPVVATELEFDYEDLKVDLDPKIKTYPVVLGKIPGESLNIGGIDDILGRELIKAPLNSSYREYDRERLETKYLNNRFDKLTTKVLESNIIDRSDAEPFTFKSVVTNYWPYLAYMGMYTSKISITVPTTGDVHQLDMMEAFVLFIYCMSAAEEVKLSNVPCLYIPRVLRKTPPHTSELEALRMEYVPKYFLDYISDNTPILPNIISPIVFNEVAKEIHLSQNGLRTMRHLQDDYKIEGNLHQIMDRYYKSIIIEPYNKQPFVDWFETREIEISTWLKEDFIEVSGSIFEQSTGVSMGRGTALKDLHSAMIRILGELTSYSVHLLSTADDSGIKILDTKFPKGTIPESVENTVASVDFNIPSITSTSGSLLHRIKSKLKVPSILRSEAEDLSTMMALAGLSSRASSGIQLDVNVQVSIPAVVSKKKPIITVNQIDNSGEVELLYNSPLLDNPLESAILNVYDQMTPSRMNLFLGM